jgi:flavin reductase (DIM6/NTAB) family NADH-FMN oxidoreductase RutF
MLEQKQKGLHCALDFCCELDSKLYQIGTVFEPRLVIDHFLVFFEVVAVHLGDPVHQSVVVHADLGWEDFVS